MLQPAGQSSWGHSPQLISSLMSLQSALLSHRYSIRIHAPSPHLCSSGMQGLMPGATKRDADGGGWGRCVEGSKTCKPRLQYSQHTTLMSYHSTHKKNSDVEKQQHPEPLSYQITTASASQACCEDYLSSQFSRDYSNIFLYLFCTKCSAGCKFCNLIYKQIG